MALLAERDRVANSKLIEAQKPKKVTRQRLDEEQKSFNASNQKSFDTDSGTGNGDCIWVVGGVSSTPKKCSSMNSAEMLDYETWSKGNKTEAFQMMNPVKEGRYGGCGAFAAGSLWICGGYSGTKHLETMEVFAPLPIPFACL